MRYARRKAREELKGKKLTICLTSLYNMMDTATSGFLNEMFWQCVSKHEREGDNEKAWKENWTEEKGS